MLAPVDPSDATGAEAAPFSLKSRIAAAQSHRRQEELDLNDRPRYSTLRDYLRVVKANRWLIAIMAITFAGAALAFSLSQQKTYTATSTLEFRDVMQDLNLIGGRGAASTLPSQLAATNSKLVNTPAVAERVKRDLKSPLSVSSLQASISTSVGSQTNLVSLQAQADDPQLAADLANSFARQTKLVAERQTRAQIDQAVRTLEKQGKGIPNFDLTYTGQLAAQLQAARAIAEPVRIVENAEAPSSPSSPNPTRNTILGLLVGLTLGLIVAFIRDSLDRRLRGTDEVHEELGMPVVGKVSETALGKVGFGVNGAAPVMDPDLESFRILRTNLEYLRQDRPLKSLLVTSGRPEEGKSTVAASLACTAALSGRRTLLVECDVRRPSLADRLGINRTPGLTDYLMGAAKPQDVVQTVDLEEPRNLSNGTHKAAAEPTIESAGPSAGTPAAPGQTVGTLVCVTAGSNPSHPAELLGSERFREFLESVTEAYEIVVIDSSPLLSVVDALQIAPEVDGVIVCARVSQTTRDEARAVRAALDRLPERPMGAVMTGLKRGDEEQYGYYGSYES
jgi:capsular polysaccharide biosynthesis protein/Mrp family chromosome partitioning ATPase